MSSFDGDIHSIALDLLYCSDFTVSSGGSITYPVDTEYIILNPGDMRYHINHVKIVLLYRSYHLGILSPTGCGTVLSTAGESEL